MPGERGGLSHLLSFGARRGPSTPQQPRASFLIHDADAALLIFPRPCHRRSRAVRRRRLHHAKAWPAQLLLERAFASGIETGRPTKPWPWADTWPVARIEVKRIGAAAVVLAGSDGPGAYVRHATLVARATSVSFGRAALPGVHCHPPLSDDLRRTDDGEQDM